MNNFPDKLFNFKNFSMVTELDIAGSFIYNGIQEFNKMDTFYFEGEVFSFLYNIAVGVERLQKVLIVLLETTQLESLDTLEKELITHSHQELHNRIKKSINLSFTPVQNEFLQILTNFYISCRYDRFSVETKFKKERNLLIDFISKHLNIEIIAELPFSTPNTHDIKEFIGRIIGNISRKYYKALYNQARTVNIYTYELRHNSPAQKVFLPNYKHNSLQEQYDNEQIVIKELLIYLMNTAETSSLINFIKSIEPLELDIDLRYILKAICEGVIPQDFIDEVEYLYEDMEDNIGDRLSMLSVIGDINVLIDDEFYDDEDEI